ncbi:hypothetical protein JCM4914_58380 [Streptomyces platensis subsp. malvinus]
MEGPSRRERTTCTSKKRKGAVAGAAVVVMREPPGGGVGVGGAAEARGCGRAVAAGGPAVRAARRRAGPRGSSLRQLTFLALSTALASVSMSGAEPA